MFTQKDVAEYYNTTQNHYEQWWNLKKSLSLHYGIWEENTKDFGEALKNTNRLLSKLSNIKESDNVLDAGCGVGGAAFFIEETFNADVKAISLSERQLSLAKQIAAEKENKPKVEFHLMDFTKTSFPDESFDVVWACESVCHAENKLDFVKESFRLLKKGGRLIICDFFKVDENQKDKNSWIDKWRSTWAVPDFATVNTLSDGAKNIGFEKVQDFDYTNQIRKSATKMYYAYLMGAIPSKIYNLFHPKVSRFAKTHYKCGYYQYKGLQEDLWRYNIILATK